MVLESTFLSLDTETTGVTPGVDEVSEVASILYDLDLKEIDRFEQKCEFNYAKMKPEAAKVNGFKKEIWDVEAKPFQNWMRWLGSHVKYDPVNRVGHVTIPIGWNVGFDRDIIDQFYYKRLNKFCPLSYHKIPVDGLAWAMKLAGFIKVPNVKQETVMRALGLGKQTHTAMDDCENSMEIFRIFLDVIKHGMGRVTTAPVIPEPSILKPGDDIL